MSEGVPNLNKIRPNPFHHEYHEYFKAILHYRSDFGKINVDLIRSVGVMGNYLLLLRLPSSADQNSNDFRDSK